MANKRSPRRTLPRGTRMIGDPVPPPEDTPEYNKVRDEHLILCMEWESARMHAGRVLDGHELNIRRALKKWAA